jgi:serine/threonine protein kinase
MSFDKKQDAYIVFRSILKEKTNKVIAWVGSGLSAPAGLPVWSQLILDLENLIESKANSIDPKDSQKLKGKVIASRRQPNNWRKMDILRGALGETSFKDILRSKYQTSPLISAPRYYHYLWEIGIRGVLNLNIDRLATKALADVHKAKIPHEFHGFQCGNCVHVLKSPNPFIANLHGIAEDCSSWVFKSNEIKSLMKDEGYKSFIRSCLSTCTIFFIGLSIDDLAVGGHLEILQELKIDTGTHFGVTTRKDLQFDRWAEKIGIRLIHYNAPKNDHKELLEFFEDLTQFLPKESEAPPVTSENNLGTGGILQSPNELSKLDADSIRRVLNIKAKEILSQNDPKKYSEFEDFCKNYDAPIYRAWYTSCQKENNILLGYILEKDVTTGAFGKVYKARLTNGNEVAIKILKQEIRSQPEWLQCFRRGVHSMRILSAHKLDGMVTYHDASEIPAFVVMDWIDGPNLSVAVLAKKVKVWDQFLKISCSLASIIRKAHRLPERVLHRDLRPPNIMLKNFYSAPTDWQVVVLDFDLSWHKGAIEKSIISAESVTGYLAPEQLQKRANVSTRHAAVDSFGLGMTLFFMLTGQNPMPSEHMHSMWRQKVEKAAQNHTCEEWHSLPIRISRLIINATNDSQSARWDMSQIEGELLRLEEAFLSPDSVKSAELIAEELITRSNWRDKYKWDEDKLLAEISLLSGIKIKIRGVESETKIDMSIEWTNKGFQNRKRLTKWLPQAATQVESSLKKRNWITSSNIEQQYLHIQASIKVDGILKNMTDIVDGINQIETIFCFD